MFVVFVMCYSFLLNSSAPYPTQKLEDSPLTAVHDYLLTYDETVFSYSLTAHLVWLQDVNLACKIFSTWFAFGIIRLQNL